jgi:serine/threonine protein kinase/tetratricopeptide (TPR) repeat protein
MTAPKPDEAAIFNAARRIEDPAARRQYVGEACGQDLALAGRVEALLRIHDEDPTFLASLAEGVRDPLGAPAAEGPGTQVGPYKLLRPIGEGGMGSVFLAEQTQPLQRQVALKVVRPGMDSRQVLARFEQERQALALMDHPNIAKVLDAGATPTGQPYFVMELIGGVPITEYCDGARLSVRRRLELFVPVCQAVQHAHQKGVIHRDLKPSNVLVTLYDGKPVPKVIDFGVAKATGQKLTERTLETQLGSVVGTLEYMSPEQAEPGQPDVDTRSDIYSLGVLLYELLTGTTPLRPVRLAGASLLDLLRAVRESEPPRPSTHLSTTGELPAVAASRDAEPRRLVGLVRGDLDWIVMKCLEKDRARRYETADALARDIERYLNVEPVEACPPSRGYRLRKFARKNRKLLLGVAAFVLLLTAATTVSLWLAIRATLAQREADGQRAQAEVAKQRADEQAEVAEAVNKFLNGDLLIQASTEHSQNRDLKLRTVLDRAADKVDERLASQPLAAARIHKTLGAAYQSLGEPGLAERHARRSYELYLGKLGPEAPLTVGAQANLATALLYQGQVEDAEKLYVEALGQMRRVFPRDDPVTLATMSNLAAVYWRHDKYEESLHLLEEALEAQKRTLGEDSRETLKTMHNLAGTYLNLKRVDDARRMYEQTLDRERLHLGASDPFTLNTTLGLADLLAFEGRHDKANELREKVLDHGSQSLPAEHPILMNARNQLASDLWQQGRYGDAIKRYEEAFDVLRRTKPGHPRTMSAQNALAWRLATAPDTKARDARRAVALAKELAERSPEDATAWNTLGVASYRADDFKGTVAALEKSEALAPGQSLGYNAVFLAMAHWKLGEKDTARQCYDRAVSWFETTKPDDRQIVQFRAEAAQLLGIPPADPPGKKDDK